LSNRIDVVYLDKERMSGSEVQGSKIVGEVGGKRVLLFDDMISGGGTLQLSADAVEKHGGTVWAACASHGIFVGKPNETLANIPRLIVTDTIRSFRLDPEQWKDRLFVIPTTMMFAQAIRRTNEEGGSISDLLQ
jgi:ribose-phosphate pyrophosphokinase